MTSGKAGRPSTKGAENVHIRLSPEERNWFDTEAAKTQRTIKSIILSLVDYYRQSVKGPDGVPLGVGYKPVFTGAIRDSRAEYILVPQDVTADALRRAAAMMESGGEP